MILYNSRKPLANIKNSSISDAVRVLYTSLYIFLSWSSPPLDFTKIPVTVILINITTLIIIIVIITIVTVIVIIIVII